MDWSKPLVLKESLKTELGILDKLKRDHSSGQGGEHQEMSGKGGQMRIIHTEHQSPL